MTVETDFTIASIILVLFIGYVYFDQKREYDKREALFNTEIEDFKADKANYGYYLYGNLADGRKIRTPALHPHIEITNYRLGLIEKLSSNLHAKRLRDEFCKKGWFITDNDVAYPMDQIESIEILREKV